MCIFLSLYISLTSKTLYISLTAYMVYIDRYIPIYMFKYVYVHTGIRHAVITMEGLQTDNQYAAHISNRQGYVDATIRWWPQIMGVTLSDHLAYSGATGWNNNNNHRYSCSMDSALSPLCSGFNLCWQWHHWLTAPTTACIQQRIRINY
jgi:hypothetical protein